MDLDRLIEEMKNTPHCYTHDEFESRKSAYGKCAANNCEHTCMFITYIKSNEVIVLNLLDSILLTLLEVGLLFALRWFRPEELRYFIKQLKAFLNDGNVKKYNCFVKSNQETNHVDELDALELVLLLCDQTTRLHLGDALNRDDRQPIIDHSYDLNGDDEDPILFHGDALKRDDQQQMLDHIDELNRVDQQQMLDHIDELNRVDQQQMLDHIDELNRDDQQPMFDHINELNRVDQQQMLDHIDELNRDDQQPMFDHINELNRVDQQQMLDHIDELNRDDQQPMFDHINELNRVDQQHMLDHIDQLNRDDKRSGLDHRDDVNRVDQKPILDYSDDLSRVDRQPELNFSVDLNRVVQQPILDHYDELNRIHQQNMLDHIDEFNRVEQQPMIDHSDELNRVDKQTILNHIVVLNRVEEQPIMNHSDNLNRVDQQPVFDHSNHLNRVDPQPIVHQTSGLSMNDQQACLFNCSEHCGTLPKSPCRVPYKARLCKKLNMLYKGTFKQNPEQLGPKKCVGKAHLVCFDQCEEKENDGVEKDLIYCEQDGVQLCKDKCDLSSTVDRSSVKSRTHRTKQELREDGKESSLPHSHRTRNENKECEENILRDLLNGIHLRIQPQELQVYMVPGINLPHPSVVCGMLWHMFKREVNRIRTFARYPVSASKSSLLLASEGFIYIGAGGNLDDHVICYFCCRQKKKWQPLDSIGVVHRELSPECPMITGLDCENEPIGTQSATLSYVTNANTQKSNVNGAMALPNASNLIETDSTLETSQPSNGRYRPHPERTNRIQLATQSLPRPIRPTAVPLVQPTVNRGFQSSNEGNSIALPSNSSYNNLSSIPAFPEIQDSTQPLLSQSPSAHASISQTTPNIPVPAQRGDAAPSLSLPAPTPTGSDGRASSQNTINTNQEVVASGMATTPVETLTGDAVPNSRGGQANTTGNTPTSSGNAKGPTYSELGIITERPKRTEYAPKISRLRTFDNWPRDHHLTPEQLSEAGFYYAGYGDCARCFYCGGGLRNWEDEDDVWVEHARWFPKCAYIRQQMGQVFVDTVQELNKQYTVIPYQMVINKTGQPSLYNLESKESPLKNDAAVKTLVALGYAEHDVLCAAKFVKEEFSLVSSDSILERLNKDSCRRVKVPTTIAPLTVSNANETLERMRTLKEKNNQLRQQTVCKICMDKEVAVVFLPCGHLISCAECASAMKDCPVCRKPVKGVVRAFIS